VTITNNSYKCDEYDKVRANKEESDFILFLSAFPSLKFRLFVRSSKKVYLYHFSHTIMDSKIQTIAPYYSKFENILPYELIHSEITEELCRARNEINKIIDEDLRNIKNLSVQNINVAKYLELSGLIFSTPSSDLSRVDNH
jgi:hypothetical protein